MNFNFNHGMFAIDKYTYQWNSYGGITQLNPEPFVYDDSYNATYDTEEYKQANDRLMAIRCKWVEETTKHNHPIALLDYGYGNGSFLDKCVEYYGKRAILDGYDIADTDYDKDKHWLKAAHPNGLYDVVCFWDSLEHLPNPEQVVRSLNTQYICISLPWLDKDNFRDWHHRKPNEHIWHFNAGALRTFFKDCGYSLVKLGCPEDKVRKPRNNRPNILTATFVRL